MEKSFGPQADAAPVPHIVYRENSARDICVFYDRQFAERQGSSIRHEMHMRIPEGWYLNGCGGAQIIFHNYDILLLTDTLCQAYELASISTPETPFGPCDLWGC